MSNINPLGFNGNETVKQRYLKKCNAVVSVVSHRLPMSWYENNILITVTDLIIDSNYSLVVNCYAQRQDGTYLDLDLPFVYVNPPTFVVDPNNLKNFNPLVAFQKFVSDTVMYWNK